MVQIESPWYDDLREIVRNMTRQDDVVMALESRFGAVPSDLKEAVKAVTETDRLNHLFRFSLVCPDLESFRANLQR